MDVHAAASHPYLALKRPRSSTHWSCCLRLLQGCTAVSQFLCLEQWP